MATWEDGPEYAPAERPDAFAMPPVPPLPDAPPRVDLAAGAPLERPEFGVPPIPVPPLTALAPAAGPTRPPDQPFEVASSSLTAQSSGSGTWSSVHSIIQPAGAAFAAAGAWDPSQPMGQGALNYPPPAQDAPAFPAPGTPQWFGPGPNYPPPAQAGGPVTMPGIIKAATPGLLICLVLGGLFYFISTIAFVVAMFLARRVAYQESVVRRTFWVAAGFLGVMAILPLLMGSVANLEEWWNAVGLWSLLCCWIVGIVVLFLQYRGLSAGAGARSRF